MARTYTQIRQLTIQQTGLRWTTGTSDTGGTIAIMRDVALARYSDDYWNGFHLLITDGTPTFSELFIQDFISTDGDVRYRPDEGAAPDARTYEILPFSGTDIMHAVQDSILELYDLGLLVRTFWMTMMSGSPLYNADYSYASGLLSQPDGWSITTSTATRERASGNIALAETSIELSALSGRASLSAQYKRYLQDFKGRTITLYCWVLTSAASTARIAWYDGTTINYSPYHSGNGTWELLHVEVSTSTTDGDVEPRLYLDTTTTAYFNLPYVLGGERVLTYPFAHDIMPDGPYEILESDPGIQRDEIATGRGLAQVRQSRHARNVTGYRVLKHHDADATSQVAILDFSQSRLPPRDGRLLHLRGDGPLTLPTTVLSTSNMEVTESESLLLATLSAIKLLERGSAGAPVSTRRMFEERLSELNRQLARLTAGAGEARDTAIYHIGW